MAPNPHVKEPLLQIVLDEISLLKSKLRHPNTGLLREALIRQHLDCLERIRDKMYVYLTEEDPDGEPF